MDPESSRWCLVVAFQGSSVEMRVPAPFRAVTVVPDIFGDIEQFLCICGLSLAALLVRAEPKMAA